MTPDRPGLWRVQYAEGFHKDFRVFLGADAEGRPCLCCMPSQHQTPGEAPTVKAMTEILESFGARWVGPSPSADAP